MSLFRPNVEQMEAYIPGEQPQEPGWTKLNTNENPYPPSPRVVEAIQSAASSPLNKYPDPLGRALCRKVGELFNVEPDAVLPANGSDENLSIVIRSFVDAGELIAYPYPSYVLYETLAAAQAARCERLLLNKDWSWDHAKNRPIVEAAKLTLVPNPNSPSGNRWSDADLEQLVPPRGVLVLDEAYGDFADRPHRAEILKTTSGRRIVITRTLSKSYSLAGLRLGFAIADPELIRGMRKVKDSYNCDSISLAAGLAALEDQDWMLQCREKIIATRTRMEAALRRLGFNVVPSQANFVWATRAEGGHQEIYESLKRRRILVRYMRFPFSAPDGKTLVDGLRISVGTDVEVDHFLGSLQEIVATHAHND